MSHISRIFEDQPIKVQNVNGFDLSHIVAGSAIVGTLTPVLSRILMQDTTFSLGCAVNVEMPPLASSFFGRIDANIEVFFVPCSILYGGWKQFISNQVANQFPSSQDSVLSAGGYALPLWQLNDITGSVIKSLDTQSYSLLDYMRWKMESDVVADFWPSTYNLLPLLSYHRVWDVFYRNPQVTKTIFAVNPTAKSFTTNVPSPSIKNVSLIWHSFFTSSDLPTNDNTGIIASCVFSSSPELSFPDGKSIFSLRQRNYSRDYFTAASVNPQQGSAQQLGFDVTVDLESGEGSGAFTIAALRNVNSLQKFLEAENYDPTYRGIMRAHFGRVPSDADHDEPTYIGRCIVPVYQKSVYNSQGSVAADSASSNSKNPYGDILAGRAASGNFSGEGSITKKFHAGCFGYLLGIFSLVPHTLYSQGVDRMHFMKEIGDFAFPELQSVGMDDIKEYEVYFSGDSVSAESADPTRSFAYLPRYSYWKYIDDVSCGQLRAGKPLQSFVLQRVFDSEPDFGTEFCEIPKSALDAVLPTSEAVSHLSCWFEIYWVFKATMPLAAFCVPTLGELQDTHTINVKQGGSRL